MHVRSKVRYRQNEGHPKGTVFDFHPGMPESGISEGEVENTVDVYDWSFGFQAWCGRCKAKLPYTWGAWHSYAEDELETLDRSDFHGHKPGPEDETAREKAVRAWNRREVAARHDGKPGLGRCAREAMEDGLSRR